MKIAFLHRDLPPQTLTGVAIQVHRLANALTDLGENITVFSLSPKSSDAIYSVEIINIPFLKELIKLFPKLRRILYPIFFSQLNFNAYDIIHVHGDGPFLNFDKRFLRTFYGTAKLERKFSPHFKGKIAQSLSAFFEYLEARKCHNTVVISPHLAIPTFRGVSVIPCMLSAHSLAPMNPLPWFQKNENPILIFLGSKGSRKRGEMALELFSNLKTRFPTLTLYYVTHQEEAKRLKVQGITPGLEIYSGLSEGEINNLYRKSLILLSISSYEGFGVPIIEALAQGCLPVCSPHLGALDLLQSALPQLISSDSEIENFVAELICDNLRYDQLVKLGILFSEYFKPDFVAHLYQHKYQEIERLKKIQANPTNLPGTMA